MKKKLLTMCSLVVLLIGATGFNAGATFITGNIGFSGADITPGSLATATQIAFGQMVVIPTPTGTFTGVPVGTTSVTMQPLTFSPIFSVTNPLWIFSAGGVTYSLDATSATVSISGPNFLNILGTGTAYGTGFTPTPYFFSITATDSSGVGSSITAGVSNSSTRAVVPVPASLFMLSSGLIGLAVIRRRFRR